MRNDISLRPWNSMHICIDACIECDRVCQGTITYCLEQAGEDPAASHGRLLVDCAEMCQTSANFMMRGSRFHNRTCRVCAEICERCGESCEQVSNDSQMRACVEACRMCADSCRE